MFEDLAKLRKRWSFGHDLGLVFTCGLAPYSEILKLRMFGEVL